MAGVQQTIEQFFVLVQNRPEFLLIAGGLGAAGYFIYWKFFKDDEQVVRIKDDVEDHKRVTLPEKAPEYYRNTFKQSAIQIEQPVYHGKATLGVVDEYVEIEVPKDPISTEEASRAKRKDDDEETETMFVFKVRSGSKLSSTVLNMFNNSGHQFVTVREDWVLDQYDGIHIEDEVKFIRYGGMLVEDTTEGINVPSRVSAIKSLEKNVNNIDEFVKRENHWSDTHSKALGKYEKEAELEEQRFGNRLRNR